ncbi:MAG TPA: hypothetical protein VMP67_11650 [Candidatus Limnocylindria bacterium]|nr:hypothetical protein [Candidatus Limnocylindria bacterium]
MTEPRNVTPPEEGEFRTRHQQERREEPEWMAWKWASGGKGFPWLGVLLVLVGVALLIQYVIPGVGAGTLVLLAIGLAFLAGWLFGGSFFSMVPGVLLVALALARLVEASGLFFAPGADVPGLTSLSLAAGFLVIYGIALSRQKRWTWALWAAGLFGLIGVVQASGWIAGIPELGVVWPIFIIAAGVVLLLLARRR